MSATAQRKAPERLYERIIVTRRATYQEANQDVAGLGIIRDLHEAGAFVELNPGLELPQPGTRVQLIFRVPGAGGYVHVLAHGTVRWVGDSLTHKTKGFGLEFDRPMSGVRESLAKLASNK